MQPLTFVAPVGQTLDAISQSAPIKPFGADTVDFVQKLSKKLLFDPKLRLFPELTALGYWARQANIARLKDAYTAAYPGFFRVPRGLAFHIAPSNVDSIFVYSLILSILVGNKNIIRISSRRSDQIEMLAGVIGEVLDASANDAVGRTIGIVRYDHDQEITDHLSDMCDLRVIWGGDETVRTIRRSPLPPHATEMAFPDKISVAVFDAMAWLKANDKAEIAKAFVNDVYWFGQMACSSPRCLFWRGDGATSAEASISFAAAVEAQVDKSDIDFSAMDFIDKLVAEQRVSITNVASIKATRSNRLRLIRVSNLRDLAQAPRAGAGFLLEATIGSLADFAPLVTRQWQTVVSFGISGEDWADLWSAAPPAGIDRIVKVGEAMNFSAVWDGADLLTTFSRLVHTL